MPACALSALLACSVCLFVLFRWLERDLDNALDAAFKDQRDDA